MNVTYKFILDFFFLFFFTKYNIFVKIKMDLGYYISYLFIWKKICNRPEIIQLYSNSPW